MIDRKKFFDAVRNNPFTGLKGVRGGQQVAGTDDILDAWEMSGLTDLRWLAYMLATALHETGTMLPVREIGRGKGRKYGKVGRHGQIAYGRGLVQLTWDYNYERADKELGLNGALIQNYDLALDSMVASKIMFRGMEEGWFTGKRLSTYLNDLREDFYNARRIINGVDKAALVAGYAKAFYGALRDAEGYSVPVAPIDDQMDDPIPQEPEDEPLGFWGRFWQTLFGRIT